MERAGPHPLLGVTHYTASAYDAVEAALKPETFDFLQINYAIDDRGAESASCRLRRTKASPCCATGRSAAAACCAG